MSLETLLKDVDKEFGAGSLVKLSDSKKVAVDVIPTGIDELDNYVLGVGGIPLGRITEIYGSESSGKTTLALTVIAQAQQAGKACAFIDAEHALDPTWAKTIGVDVDNLLVSQPDCGDDALRIVDMIVKSGEVQVIVVDSVAMLVPRAELEGDIGDANVGQQARLMSQAMRKLTGPVKTANVALIFINQIRDKIGVSFGSPTTTSGGRGLKFAASVRLDVARIGTIKKGDEPVGNKVKIKAAKNKLSPPFRDCEVELRFNAGFDTTSALLDKLIADGKIINNKAWFVVGEEKFQGRENMLLWLKENKDKF